MRNTHVANDSVLGKNDNLCASVSNVHKSNCVFSSIQAVLFILSKLARKHFNRIGIQIRIDQVQVLSFGDIVHDIHIRVSYRRYLEVSVSGRISLHQSPIVIELVCIFGNEIGNIVFDNARNVFGRPHRIVSFSCDNVLFVNRKECIKDTRFHVKLLKMNCKHLKQFGLGKAACRRIKYCSRKQYQLAFFFSVCTDLGLSLTKISYHDTFPHRVVPPLIDSE